MNTQHIGSDFDDFLAKEGLLADAEAVAIKRVMTFQQKIEADISSLIDQLQLPTSRTNHKMLTEWLNKSSTTPNEYDEAWWDEFEKELRNNRLNLNRMSSVISSLH